LAYLFLVDQICFERLAAGRQRLVYCFQGIANPEEVFFCDTVVGCDAFLQLLKRLPTEAVRGPTPAN
jgi:hypothetical protein